MKSYLSGNKGQTLTEYALTLLLITLVVLVMLGNFGDTVESKYSFINSSLPM
jgi:Flp pilus assembly pilin Flp